MATIYFPDARMAMSRWAKGTNKDYEQVTSSVQDSFARCEHRIMSENARLTIGY